MRKIRLMFLCFLILSGAVVSSVQSQQTGTITADNAESVELLQTFEGHLGAVNGVAIRSDGEVIASVGDDATLRLWNVNRGTQIAEVYEHFSFVKDVAYNPQDDDVLVTASWDRTVIIWDASNEIPAVDRLIQGYSGVIDTLAFSRSGELIAFGIGDGTVNVRDLTSDEVVDVLELDALPVTAVAISPDSSRLVAAGGFPDDTAKIWDIETGELLETLTGHLGSVTAIAFHPDGDVIATGGDDSTIRLWSDGEETAVLVQEDWVVDLAFDPSGTVLAAALQDGTVRLWNVEEENLEATLDAHDGLVNAVSFDVQGTRLVTAGDDGLIKIWGLAE